MAAKLLILGANGQVGWELQRATAPLGAVVALDRSGCDLADAEAIRRAVEEYTPDVVINAAAYTAVDKAESDAETAQAINAVAPGILAQALARRNALLVHYSTDYVFDGSADGAYPEDAPTNPLSVYGRTKLEGEIAIRQSGCKHLIFRTSWVYGPRGANFVRTILRLAREKTSLAVVDDQIGAPTSSELIADVTALCLARVLAENMATADTYHLTAGGAVSWCGYARFIVKRARELGMELALHEDHIRPIPSSDYPVPARRPANSRLATDKLNAAFGIHAPPWQHHVERMLRIITER